MGFQVGRYRSGWCGKELKEKLQGSELVGLSVGL